MSLISLQFLVFLAISLLLYYLVPKRIQWWVLLAASLTFYTFSGISNLFFILFSILLFFFGSQALSNIKNKFRARFLIAAILLLNFGLLAVFKLSAAGVRWFGLLGEQIGLPTEGGIWAQKPARSSPFM